MSEVVKMSVAESIAWVEISRPEALNALNLEVLEGLRAVCQDLQARIAKESYQTVRAVVIRSAGDKAFVAGADIKLMQKAAPDELARFIELGQSAMLAIEQTPLAVLAMVQGYAIGGGLELALACDLIAASDRAHFGQAEVNLGLIPGFGGTQRLAERVGSGSARRLVYTAENVSAEEALRLHLVDYVFPHDQLAEKTKALAALIASKGPVAIAAAKQAIAQYSLEQKRRGLAAEVQGFCSVFSSADAQEGLSAFIEKRTPNFPGN